MARKNICKQHLERLQLYLANERVPDKPIIRKETPSARNGLTDFSGLSEVITLSTQFTFKTEVGLLTEPDGSFFRVIQVLSAHHDMATAWTNMLSAASELCKVYI